MARYDTRFSVYPAPKAIQILGNTAPALNQAIECWAALLARCTADNGRTFHGYLTTENGDVIESLHEWNVLSEVLKDTTVNPEFQSPGSILASAVEDAYRLENIRGACFLDDEDDHPKESRVYPGWKTDAALAKLVDKLRGLDYPHAWAVIVAVQWYWAHQEQPLNDRNQWWTLAFRREWAQEEAKEKPVSRRRG